MDNENQDQNFEVYAVPKKSAYVLTKDQLDSLEERKDLKQIERNARIFEKINLRIDRDLDERSR